MKLSKFTAPLAVCLAVFLLALVLPAGVNAAAETDGIFTYTITGGETTITDCEEDVTGALEIPSVLGGCPVTTIGSNAFSNCKMTSLTIPNSVITIDYSAFYSCKELRSLTIPDSVVTIGNSAFSNCSKLESVTLGNGLKEVISPFYNCTSLKTVHISDLTVWCNIKFYWDYSNPLEYAQGLYVNGELIEDLIIPSGVTAIHDNAFFGSKIKSVTIPGSVETIGTEAFAECPALTDVTIGEGATSLNDKAFWMCPSLTTVTLPDSLTEMGNEVFWRCEDLTNLTVGKGLKTVGKQAFKDCQKLDKLNISDLAVWCDIEFYDIHSNPLSYSHKIYLNGVLVEDLVIPEGVTIIRNNAFYSNRSVTALTIPDSVTTIGSGAFAHNLELKKVTMGSGVTSIGTVAFSDCTALEDVYITDLAAWCEIVFYSDLANPLYFADDFYVNGSSVESLVIPDGVTKIGRYAFVNCRQLTSVELPESLKNIDSNAFTWSESIAHVYFNGSEEQWDSITIGFGNDPLTNAKLHIRGTKKAGDIDGNYGLDTDDAVYLLLTVLFGTEDYPVPDGMDLDFDGSGEVDTDDAVYLLLHVLFGAEDYPLYG